jgi:hypothetical protein
VICETGLIKTAISNILSQKYYICCAIPSNLNRIAEFKKKCGMKVTETSRFVGK